MRRASIDGGTRERAGASESVASTCACAAHTGVVCPHRTIGVGGVGASPRVAMGARTHPPPTPWPRRRAFRAAPRVAARTDDSRRDRPPHRPAAAAAARVAARVRRHAPHRDRSGRAFVCACRRRVDILRYGDRALTVRGGIRTRPRGCERVRAHHDSNRRRDRRRHARTHARARAHTSQRPGRAVGMRQ